MATFVGETGAAWSYDEGRPIGDPSGMGRVFEGESPAGVKVAIKRVLLGGMTEDERKQRMREIDISDVLRAGAAGSPMEHVLIPLDRGTSNEGIFIAMPLADYSLSAALTSGRIPTDDAEHIIRSIAAGLVELSVVGVLHRDLKPANVLYLDGRWLLADFGISRDLARPTGSVTMNLFMTPEYSAPERFDSGIATNKSDLYSLGVVGYEILTGRLPFEGSVEALLDQHLNSLPEIPGDPDRAAVRIVMRLLAKKSADRPQDARAVVEAMDRAADTLTEEQTLLAIAKFEAEQRAEIAEAGARAKTAHIQKVADERHQARADLVAVLEEGVLQARNAIGDGVALEANDVQAIIECDPVWLLFALWVPEQDGDTADPLILGAEVYAGGKTRPRALVANAAYERSGSGTLQWSLSTFEGNTGEPNRQPSDGPHGLDRQNFRRIREAMRRPGLRGWIQKEEPLDPRSVLTLLRVALEGTVPEDYLDEA